MRSLIMCVAVICLLGACGQTNIDTTVTHRVAPPSGYLSDTQQYRRVAGSEVLSRGQLLRGSGLDTARIVANRLHAKGYRDMVCRDRPQNGGSVVRCAYHRKLQAYVSRNNEPAFTVQKMPQGYLGLSAVILIDFGRGYYHPPRRHPRRVVPRKKVVTTTTTTTTRYY